MTSMKTHLKRARAGAEYLDGRYEGWLWQIMTGDVLNLGSSHYCVLGQLYDELGEWESTVLAAGFEGVDDPRLVRYGFVAKHETAEEAEDLTQAWDLLIKDLRSQARAAAFSSGPQQVESSAPEPVLALTEDEVDQVIASRRRDVAVAEQALDEAEEALRQILKFVDA